MQAKACTPTVGTKTGDVLSTVGVQPLGCPLRMYLHDNHQRVRP